MQSMPTSADPSGFFVDWQLADSVDEMLDIAAEESGTEVVLPDDADARTSAGT
jgi:hypothetical protein